MLYRTVCSSSIVLLCAAPLTAQTAKPMTPQPGAVREIEIAPGVKMAFCWIPAGEAQLGSPDAERQACLKVAMAPAEKLRLATEPEEKRGKFKTPGFWLGKYTVTQAEWAAVMGKNPSIFVPSHDAVKKAAITDTSRFPVETVSWHDCHEFLAKLNALPAAARAAVGPGQFALPHEDQWEYACRGGLGNARAYYFGNEHNGTQANSQGEHPFGTETPGIFLRRPAPVGSYEKVAPHPWGLADMHGNMWQWCENKYEETSDNRVVRGGTYSSGCRGARSACRTGRAPTERTTYYGLRVILLPGA